jgi:CRISPR-associated endonuclease/helicase Cas3
MSIAHCRDADGVEQKILGHLIGVSDRASLFASKIGLRTHGELIGLVHDLGKYSQEFQEYIKSSAGLIDPDAEDFVDIDKKRGKIDHSSAGAQLVWMELSKKGKLGQIVGQVLSLCIASHHSGLIDCIGSSDDMFGEDLFTRRMRKSEERVHLKEALSIADTEIITRFNTLVNRPELISDLKQAFAKIIVEQPGRDDQSLIVCFHFGLLVRFLFSALIDADRLDTADFEKPHATGYRLHGCYEEWDTLIERLERSLADIKTCHPIDNLRGNISLNNRG